MSSLIDSFIGTWRGKYKGGLSSTVIVLKKEGGKLTGTWTIEASFGSETIKNLEVIIEEPEIEGNTLSFLPGGDVPSVMAMRLIGDSEAVFGPILDQRQFERDFPRLAKAVEERINIIPDRPQIDFNSPEVIKAIEDHQVNLVRE